MLCKDCHKREIDTTRSKRCCSICLDARIKSQKRYNDSSGQIRKQKLRSNGICTICGKGSLISNNMCAVCKGKNDRLHKEYYKTHKKEIQEGQKRSMAKKPEHYKKKKHETYEKHKDDWYRWRRERIARVRNSKGTFTRKQWYALLDKYEHRCLKCGSNKRLEADHVIPLSVGGSNYIDNIQPLCRTCNASKGTKILDFRPPNFNVLGG